MAMKIVKVEHMECKPISSVYYDNSFIGFIPDGDSNAMERLMKEVLKRHNKDERNGWLKAVVTIAKLVYNLPHDEVSEDRMVEIVKENFKRNS